MLRLERHQRLLTDMASRRDRPEGQRVAAIKALAAIDVRRHAGVLGNIAADPDAPLPLREQAILILALANQPETRAQLLQALPVVPARLQNATASGLAGSREGAEKLLEAVASGKASARLLQDRIVSLRLQQAKVPGLKERLAKLTAGLPEAGRELQDLLNRRRQAFLATRKDPALGLKVFEKNCATCHQLAGQGAKIGPQLDGIGARGLDRLLEDTLDPNRNVDQAFRTTTLELKKGAVVSGLLVKEEGEVLVLADSQGKEVRVPRSEVAERTVTQMSPMPANFAEQIPEADFYNLLAYLLQQRAERSGGR
jgi:putative heme-binding domain-containing protein